MQPAFCKGRAFPGGVEIAHRGSIRLQDGESQSFARLPISRSSSGVRPRRAHAPVSQATLDKSVAHLAAGSPDFASVDEGIAEWRRDASAGVFIVSLAEIVEMGDF